MPQKRFERQEEKKPDRQASSLLSKVQILETSRGNQHRSQANPSPPPQELALSQESEQENRLPAKTEQATTTTTLTSESQGPTALSNTSSNKVVLEHVPSSLVMSVHRRHDERPYRNRYAGSATTSKRSPSISGSSSSRDVTEPMNNLSSRKIRNQKDKYNPDYKLSMSFSSVSGQQQHQRLNPSFSSVSGQNFPNNFSSNQSHHNNTQLSVVASIQEESEEDEDSHDSSNRYNLDEQDPEPPVVVTGYDYETEPVVAVGQGTDALGPIYYKQQSMNAGRDGFHHHHLATNVGTRLETGAVPGEDVLTTPAAASSTSSIYDEEVVSNVRVMNEPDIHVVTNAEEVYERLVAPEVVAPSSPIKISSTKTGISDAALSGSSLSAADKNVNKSSELSKTQGRDDEVSKTWSGDSNIPKAGSSIRGVPKDEGNIQRLETANATSRSANTGKSAEDALDGDDRQLYDGLSKSGTQSVDVSSRSDNRHHSNKEPSRAELISPIYQRQVATRQQRLEAFRERKARAGVVAQYQMTQWKDEEDSGVAESPNLQTPLSVDSLVSDLRMTMTEEDSPLHSMPPEEKKVVASPSQSEVQENDGDPATKKPSSPSALKKNRKFFPEEDDDVDENTVGESSKAKSSVSWADLVDREEDERVPYAIIRPSISGLTTPGLSLASPPQNRSAKTKPRFGEDISQKDATIEEMLVRAKKAVSALKQRSDPDPARSSSRQSVLDKVWKNMHNRDAPSTVTVRARARPDAPPDPTIGISTSSLTGSSGANSSLASPIQTRASTTTDSRANAKEVPAQSLPTVSEENEPEKDSTAIISTPAVLSQVDTTLKESEEEKKEEDNVVVVAATPQTPKHGQHVTPGHRIVRLEQVADKTIIDPYGDYGVYTGILLRGKPHGQGSMIYADGREYIGEWKNGCWNGHGRTTYSNGDTFSGQYKMDKREGMGRYEWADGRIYNGEFSNDQREGQGTFSFPDGSVYSGGFHAGHRHGNGCYKFADTAIYNGEFKEGKYHGAGECIWADGRCYLGEWVDGRAHGYGVEIRADGSIRHDGEWRDDRPVRYKSDSTDPPESDAGQTSAEEKSTAMDPTGLVVGGDDWVRSMAERQKEAVDRSRRSRQTEKNVSDSSMSSTSQRPSPERLMHLSPRILSSSSSDPPPTTSTARHSKYSVGSTEPQWAQKIREKKLAARQKPASTQRILIRE